MQHMTKLFALLCFLFLGNAVMAQGELANASEFTSKGITTTDLKEINDDTWSFFVDEESNTYYIDFENLKVNLSDIVVKNDNGQVVLKDDVFDLPVNTIYELDFSEFQDGTYDVELRSFTGVIRRTIDVK